MSTLAEVMANVTPNPNYEGVVTNDDNILAINVSGSETDVSAYAVVQNHISGIDASINSEYTEKTFIRSGKSSTKTSSQRGFEITGERVVGDPFQDYVFSHAVMFGTGQAAVADYVFFNMLTGMGEKGKMMISVNSDGSGNAGESSEISVTLKATSEAPSEFDYLNQTTNQTT